MSGRLHKSSQSDSLNPQNEGDSAVVIDLHASVSRDRALPNQDSDIHTSPWWFASFAVPVLGATFGPIATTFSICALLRPWFLTTETGAPIPAPPGSRDLIVLNIVQLCIATVASVSLLLGLLGKVRYRFSLFATIAGYYISSFCLVALVVVSSQAQDALPIESVWSQSFYYCLYAGGIHFLLASLMLVNFLGAQFWGLKSDITQSTALCTLLWNTIVFLAFVFLGALVFGHIEGWQYQDAVYWADVTLLTIGFGDFAPETTLGRALLFPYAIAGITSLGITLASIRRLVLDRGKLAMRKRRLGKMREEFLRRHPESETIPLCDHDRLASICAEARRIQSKASRKWRWISVGMSLMAWLVLLFGGAAVFVGCERRYQDWTYFEGVYMAFISLTTIGYGDLTPTSSCGRSFFVLWSLLGVPTITIVISNLETPLLKVAHDMQRLVGGTMRPHLWSRASRRIRRPINGPESQTTDDFVDGRTGKNPSQNRPSPGTREQYCVVVLDEMLGIMRHLCEQPLRPYSTDDWAWFGKLLGGWANQDIAHDDKIQGQRERRRSSTRKDGVETMAPGLRVDSTSPLPRGPTVRLGQYIDKSPLMGPREEAEWFLDMLAATLRRELVMMDRHGCRESSATARQPTVED